MWRLITFLFTGCFHKWEQIDKGSLYQKESDPMPVGNWYDCKCTKCGSIKRFKTGA